MARVFALVVRCRVIRLLLYSRVGKNRDTNRGTPAGAGAGRGASHKTTSLVTQLSRHGAPIAYTDLLCAGLFLISGFDIIQNFLRVQNWKRIIVNSLTHCVFYHHTSGGPYNNTKK